MTNSPQASVLLLSFTDQYSLGFSGKFGITLNCSTDVNEAWYGSLVRVYGNVLRYDLFRGANRAGICVANREIIEIAAAYRPAYVFYPCNFSGIVTQATLVTLREMGCIVVADFFDEDSLFQWCKEMISRVDYIRAQAEYMGYPMLFRNRQMVERDIAENGRPPFTAVVPGVNSLRRFEAGEYYKWTRALLRSPAPLRSECRDTAALVLATDPAHRGARRLLARNRRWGDPDPAGKVVRSVGRGLQEAGTRSAHLVRSALSRLASLIRNTRYRAAR